MTNIPTLDFSDLNTRLDILMKDEELLEFANYMLSNNLLEVKENDGTYRISIKSPYSGVVYSLKQEIKI